MCGEQAVAVPFLREPPGSPPRVRGTDACILHAEAAEGITPACAGNSPYHVISAVAVRITPACAGNRASRVKWNSASKDHPRVCGEQLLRLLILYQPEGSPPRVRGTEAEAVLKAMLNRITPACAGNSKKLYQLPKAF